MKAGDEFRLSHPNRLAHVVGVIKDMGHTIIVYRVYVGGRWIYACDHEFMLQLKTVNPAV